MGKRKGGWVAPKRDHTGFLLWSGAFPVFGAALDERWPAGASGTATDGDDYVRDAKETNRSHNRWLPKSFDMNEQHDIPVHRARIEPFLKDDRAWARADAQRILDRPA